ncbi:MAG: flagellar basal body-associated FliL family protein [Thermodesulfobacteriota bacterium]
MAKEKDAKAPEEGGEKKKSKLMLFIIIGVVVVALAGGGFFIYTTFLAPPPEAPAEAQGVKPAELGEKVGEMFQMDPFVVNLSDPKGKRYLKVTISLELANALAVEKATKLTPKLRDMVIIMLTSLTFEEVMTPEGKMQIRDELLERFNGIMRPDRVSNIYFTDFVVQ